MEPDSVPGDMDSLQGGLSLLDPLVDRILGDSVSQQQGWLRVYGKENSPRGRRGGNTSSGVREGEVGTGTGPDLSSKVRNRSSRTSWRFDPETGLWLSSDVNGEPHRFWSKKFPPAPEAQTRPGEKENPKNGSVRRSLLGRIHLREHSVSNDVRPQANVCLQEPPGKQNQFGSETELGPTGFAGQSVSCCRRFLLWERCRGIVGVHSHLSSLLVGLGQTRILASTGSNLITSESCKFKPVRGNVLQRELNHVCSSSCSILKASSFLNLIHELVSLRVRIVVSRLLSCAVKTCCVWTFCRIISCSRASPAQLVSVFMSIFISEHQPTTSQRYAGLMLEQSVEIQAVRMDLESRLRFSCEINVS
ncbi:hypothetical protein GOODEAATRI_001220 [Goodea atripinnis]|uniref:Uncharacterized protein n=1 Tax=Goodea atripinnis TaxID=208336 RepID=A0ABV0PAF7_9TELE